MIILNNRIFRLKIIKLKSTEFNIIKKYSLLDRNKKAQTTNNFNFTQILARIFKGKESVNKQIIQTMKKLMRKNCKKDMEKVLKCFKCQEATKLVRAQVKMNKESQFPQKWSPKPKNNKEGTELEINRIYKSEMISKKTII